MITVTSVTVSPDLRDATVNVSVFPAEHQKLTMHGLTSAARHIRREAGELVAMRQLPTLHFKLDTSLKRQAAVIEALSLASHDDEDPGHTEAGDAPPPTPPSEDSKQDNDNDDPADTPSGDHPDDPTRPEGRP